MISVKNLQELQRDLKTSFVSKFHVADIDTTERVENKGRTWDPFVSMLQYHCALDNISPERDTGANEKIYPNIFKIFKFTAFSAIQLPASDTK